MSLEFPAWRGLSLFLAVIVFTAAPLFGQEGSKTKEPAKKTTTGAEVEVRFIDGSTMKLQLRETNIELETEYGKLLIPIADIRRIDFGQRIDEETRTKIAAAIKDLESSDFRHRDGAATLLTRLKEKAYPALSHAKTKDSETKRRIEQIMEKIREDVAADTLEVPPHDIVHTANSRIAGRIKGETMRVSTLPFGEQPAKLADMRTLRSGDDSEGSTTASAGELLLDPGMMRMNANQIGKTFSFRVTAPGAQFAGQMGVWGTDVYTTDTSLAAAAVHAGVLRPGETGAVRVTFVGQHPGFMASMRNGVMSNGYGPYPGYRIEQPKNAARK